MALFGKKKELTPAEQSLDAFKKVLPKKLLEDLKLNLLPDESIQHLIQGIDDSSVIATTHRVFVFSAGGLGSQRHGMKLASWSLEQIHGVQIETNKRRGVVIIQTPSAPPIDASFGSEGGVHPVYASNAILFEKRDEKRVSAEVAAIRQLLLKRNMITQALT